MCAFTFHEKWMWGMFYWGWWWFVPFFMTSGLEKCRGGGGFLTTNYTDLHGWKWWDLFLSYFDGRVEHKDFCRGKFVPLFIKNGTKSAAEKPPHFIKCGGSFERDYIHISWKVNVGWRVRFVAETFDPQFMKIGCGKVTRGVWKIFFGGDFWWGGLKSAAEYGIICAVGYGELFE